MIASLSERVHAPTALLRRVLGGRTKRNFAWATVGTAASAGGQALGMMLAARLLGPEDFGRLGLVVATAFMLYNVVGSAVGSNLVRFIGKSRADDPAMVGRMIAAFRAYGLGCATVAVLVVLLAHDPLADWLGGPHAGALVWLALAFLVLTLLAEIEAGIVTAYEDFRARAATGLVSGAIALPAISLGAWSAGLTGAFVGVLAAAASTWLGNRWASAGVMRSNGVPYVTRPLSIDLKLTGLEVLTTSVAGVVTIVAMWLSLVMLSRIPNGLVEVGIFVAARQWLVVASFLPMVLTRVVMPGQAARSSGPRAEARHFTRRHAGNVLLMTIAAAVPIGLASPWLMPLYGAAYAHAWPVLAILMLSIAVQSPGSVLQGHLLADGRTRLLLVIALAAGAATLAVAALLFSLGWGATGAAVSMLVGVALRSVALLWAAR